LPQLTLSSSHDLSLVARYADRAYVMHSGNIVEEGEVASLLTAPQNPYTQKLIAASQPEISPPFTANADPFKITIWLIS